MPNILLSKLNVLKHEDMLFHEGGVCDTLGIQGFLRFSGELVSFVELGQLDLIKVL